MTTPCRFDWGYDREYAADGDSRYAAYLNQHSDDLGWAEDIADFTAVAWRIATGPIMVPPLVHHHPRITSATVYRSNWNGRLTGDVSLIVPAPSILATVRTPDHQWRTGRPTSYSGDYEALGDQDIAERPYLLAEARILWQLPTLDLPQHATVPANARFRVAVACLEAVVPAMNDHIQPLIAALENS